jgi:hypothetical protein
MHEMEGFCINRRIFVSVLCILLFLACPASCEETENKTQDQPEDIFDDIHAFFYNHLFEVRDYVNVAKCHELLGLQGSNITIGIWESTNGNTISSKVDDSRSELTGRIYIVDDCPGISVYIPNAYYYY